MKKILKQVFSDHLITQATILTIVFLLLSIISIIITWSSLPPIIPIYNQASWGDARLAARIYLFLPVLIVFIAGLINLVLARLYMPTMPLVARFLALSITFSAILVFIFDIRTLKLII